MPLNAYFAQYQSPNIIIVPTESFSSPGPEKQANPTYISSSRLGEQTVDNVFSELSTPSDINCNQQNFTEEVTVNSNWSTQVSTSESSDYFANSAFQIQDTISTQALSNNMSQSIKELSTSKYKSRNNLVDLTGFNLLKRGLNLIYASSLTKFKDSRQVNINTIEQDKMKTSYGKEQRDSSDSDTCKTDNISYKESIKSVKPKTSHCEKNTESNANSKPKENTTNMEDKMKKYFRHLWKSNIDTLKYKSAKETPDRISKNSSRIRQDSKDSKPESSRNKANLQKVSKTKTTKFLKNKIIDNSRKYHDLERRFIAIYSRRSNSESKTRLLANSKESLRDRKIDSSSVSIRRYKDFQRSLRQDIDRGNKYKTGIQNKSEHLPNKKIQIKSSETSTNDTNIKKKDERNRSVKREKHSKVNTNQTNMEKIKNKMKLIKSVIGVNENLPNNSLQSKCDNEVPDLRSRLSRKRTRSKSFEHSHKPVENILDRDSLVITVKQDMKTDSKKMATLTPNVNKAKPQKCKKIKLVINIECPNSDSDDSDQNFKECCTSPEDLSFLDDFNLDEIVDSLNNSQHSQVEHSKILTTDNTKFQLINTINDNKNKSNDEIKSKGSLINDFNMNAIQTKQEENSLHKGQVIHDEIVDLLNKSQHTEVEHNKELTKNNTDSQLINKINEDDNKNKCNEEIKPKKGMFNDLNMKAFTIRKEETSLHKGQVISVDKIVDSLNNSQHSQAEQNKILTTGNTNSQHINEINENKYKNKCFKETKTREDLINDLNMKATKTKKEETSSHKEQVIVIHSDTEDGDFNLDIESFAKKCKAEQIMQQKSKIDKNTSTKQDTNNITVLTGKPDEGIAQEEIMDLCNDSNDSALDVIDITDENEHYNSSKLSLLARNEKRSGSNKGVSNVDRIFELLTRSNKHVQKRKESEKLIKKSHTTVNTSGSKKTKVLFSKHEDTTQTPLVIEENVSKVELKSKLSDITAKKAEIHLQKSEDPIETSLEIMFNHIEQKKHTVIRRDVINVEDENVNSQNSEDTIEASLETFFNNNEQNCIIHQHIEPFNRFDKKGKENVYSQNPVDAVEASLEAIFNGTKQQDTGINMDTEQPSLSGEHIKKQRNVLQTDQVTIEVPRQTMSNKVKQKKNLNKIEMSNLTDKCIKMQPEYSQKSVKYILPETSKNTIAQKANIEINAKPSTISHFKQNNFKLSRNISKKHLETEKNMPEKKASNNKTDIIPICKSNKNVKGNALLRTFEDTVKKPLGKPVNNVEKKIIPSQISHKHIQEKLDAVSCENLTKNAFTLASFIEKIQADDQMDARPKHSLSQNNKAKESLINNKENCSQKLESKPKKPLVTEENMLEKKANNKIDIIPLCRPDKKIKGHLRTLENTVKKPMTETINNIEKKTNNVIPSPSSKKIVPEKLDERLFGSENTPNETLRTAKIFVEKFPAAPQIVIRPQNSLSHNNKAKGEPLQKSEEIIEISLEATIDFNEQKTNIRSESYIFDKNKEVKTLPKNSEVISENLPDMGINNIQQQTNIVTNVELTNSSKNIESTSKKTSKTTCEKSLKANNKESKILPDMGINNIQQQTNIVTKVELINPNKNIEKTSEKTSITTCEKSLNANNKESESLPDKGINNIQHKTNIATNVELTNPSKNIESTSKKTSKTTCEKSLNANNKESESLPDKGINNIQHKTNIATNVELTNPSKNIESTSKKTSKTTCEKSLNANNKGSENVPDMGINNIQHKTNIATNVELIKPNKNVESTSKKTITTCEKLLKANNKELVTNVKSTVEGNLVKSLETAKNNIQKPLDDSRNTKDSNIKVTNKDSELDKRAKVATKSKIHQEQIHSNRSIVPDQENEHESKSNNEEVKPFLAKLEARMCDYLDEKYTVKSIIHYGRFSSIYKCNDIKGQTYAVKVVHQRNKGIHIEGLLFQLKRNRSKEDLCVIYLMSAFEVQGQWCLLTEYYPKNLEQALSENQRGFHIDKVQVLSRQLVDAVNMLTNSNIIHSDIKSSHILLNGAQDRLKLCGFDRSNYRSCMKILPSTGTTRYRAPEIILGFSEDHRIDVWSTALVMFEMATNKKLFSGYFNNQILYQQLCTLGSFDWTMVKQSRYRDLYFIGTSFIRQLGGNGQKSTLVHSFHRNKRLRITLFLSYSQNWAQTRTRWQTTKDMDKIETLNTLLEQMLALDPRHRLPIRFVGASEFMNHDTH